MAAPFDEIQMPAKIALGAVGGPVYNTAIYPLSGGDEDRNQNWKNGRYQWTLTHWMKNADAIQQMLTFFHARGAKARGFRFKDVFDYSVTSYAQFATGDGATTQFQLYKPYIDPIRTYLRPIKKPVNDGNLSMKVDTSVIPSGAGAGHFICDYTTGLITFGTPPANLAPIYWLGNFDVPVRFDTDELGLNYMLNNAAAAEGLPIIELRR